MFFSSPLVAALSKSKRLVVRLVSAAETGFFYVTEKSPGTKEQKIALRKHDPVANAHVMFTEQKGSSAPSKRKPIKQSSARHIRLTGRKSQLLTQAVDKVRAKAKAT